MTNENRNVNSFANNFDQKIEIKLSLNNPNYEEDLRKIFHDEVKKQTGIYDHSTMKKIHLPQK